MFDSMTSNFGDLKTMSSTRYHHVLGTRKEWWNDLSLLFVDLFFVCDKIGGIYPNFLRCSVQISLEERQAQNTHSDTQLIKTHKTLDEYHYFCTTKAGWHLAKFWFLGLEKFDGTESNMQSECI